MEARGYMNVIFLDIDGVLNCQDTEERCNGVIGIDSDKVGRLAHIAKAHDAKLLLTSSWRLHWWKPETTDSEQHPLGEYLDKKLAEHGLAIYDKVPYAGFNRGAAIRKYIKNSAEPVDKFIVIDDEEFDFKEEDVWLMPYLVKTTFYGNNGGLQDIHVWYAERKFNKQVDRS